MHSVVCAVDPLPPPLYCTFELLFWLIVYSHCHGSSVVAPQACIAVAILMMAIGAFSIGLWAGCASKEALRCHDQQGRQRSTGSAQKTAT